MAEFGVYLKTISRIDPIEGADAIEVATVGGYQCVVGKGTYAPGDTVLYIPEDAILPDPLISHMGLEGRLAGKMKNRVKAIKLRGVLSQGLVLRWPTAIREEFDYAPMMNITKYVAPIPASFNGEAVHADGKLEPWIEIDAVKAMRSFDGEKWIDPFDRTYVEATLKIHGTAFCCTMNADGTFYVSSKGMGRQGIALADGGNVYWRAVHAFDIDSKLGALVGPNRYDRVSLYGEVFGPGIQDLTYAVPALSFRAFDLKINGRWASPAVARGFCDEVDIPFVPPLYAGPYNYDRLVALAESIPETLDGLTSKTHEGIVLRTYIGPRLVGKIVSVAYLTRKGGTEFN